MTMMRVKLDKDLEIKKSEIVPLALSSAFYLKPTAITKDGSETPPISLATSNPMRPEFLARDTFGAVFAIGKIEVFPEDEPDPGEIEKYLDQLYVKYEKQVKKYKDLRNIIVEKLEGIHAQITSSSTATNNMASLMYQMIDKVDPSNRLIQNRPETLFKAQYFTVSDYNMFEEMIDQKFTSFQESSDPENEKSWNSLIWNLKARRTEASWAWESVKALEDFLHYVMQSPNVDIINPCVEASDNSTWDRILFKFRFILYCYFKTQGTSLLNYKINKKNPNDLLLLWKGFKDCHLEGESNFHTEKAEKIYHPGYLEAIKRHLMLMPEFLIISLIKKSEIL